MSSEARKTATPFRSVTDPGDSTEERSVPRFVPPATPISTRYYTGKGAKLSPPPPVGDTGD